jgi:hypothetical protein
MPDGGDLPTRARWARLARVGWRPFVLGALAVVAYQFALHFYMYWQVPRGARLHGSMPFIPAMLGTPVGIGWGVLLAMGARRLCGGWNVSGRMLGAAFGWMLLVVTVFCAYVAAREGWETVSFWIGTILLVTGMCVVTLPMTVFIYTGFAA